MEFRAYNSANSNMTNFSKCCIRTCGHLRRTNKDGTPGCILFKFPKEIKRCQEWVRLAGEEDLIHLPMQKLNGCRYICGCHFEIDQFSNKTRRSSLKKSAIPSIFPASHSGPLRPELMVNFPPTTIIKIPMEAHHEPLIGPHLNPATQNMKASEFFTGIPPAASACQVQSEVFDSGDYCLHLSDQNSHDDEVVPPLLESNLHVEPALKKLALSVGSDGFGVGTSEYELLEALEENDPFNSDADNITIVTSFTPEPMPDHEYCNRAHIYVTQLTPEQRTQELNSALQNLPQEVSDQYMAFLQLSLKHIGQMNLRTATRAINDMKQALFNSPQYD